VEPRPDNAASPARLLRDARIEDLAQIVEIYNRAIPGRRATADLTLVTVAQRRAWFARHGANRPLWVCSTEAQTVAGWLSFEDFYGRPAYRRTAEVSVYVAPGAQRQGTGSFLLATAIERAPGLGLSVLVGFIFGHNTPSLSLFERHGFVRSGTLHRVAELDGTTRDLVIVTRHLGDRAGDAG
jgi:L-amino acid N-acyltransferase YncA